MHLPRSAQTTDKKGTVATKREDWIFHEDGEYKGFRAGDLVQWNRRGPRWKIRAIAQLKKDMTRWYAYVELQGPEEKAQMFGLDYITKCDAIEQLGARADE
jgi:transposase